MAIEPARLSNVKTTKRGNSLSRVPLYRYIASQNYNNLFDVSTGNWESFSATDDVASPVPSLPPDGTVDGELVAVKSEGDVANVTLYTWITGKWVVVVNNVAFIDPDTGLPWDPYKNL
jgi:hypothetical protein